MSNVWETQKDFLQQGIKANQESVKRMAQKSLGIIERNSSASQEEALRNGEPQPMLIVRMKTKEIKITAFVGDELYVGDIVDCFSEKWLVMEAFTNENGIRYGTAWACNHIFRFQNGTQTVLERHGIIDDGNYITGAKAYTQLPLEQGYYRVYLPLDEDTKKIFVNKRFAIGNTYNERLEPILSVIRAVWIDPKSRCVGDGSHLLSIRMERDVHNAQEDNAEEMVCNYISATAPSSDPPPGNPDPDNPMLRCVIEGRETVRIGTQRTFTVKVVNEANEAVDITGVDFVWTYNSIAGIVFTPNGTQLNIQVPLNLSLIGSVIELSVAGAAAEFIPGVLSVEVTD